MQFSTRHPLVGSWALIGLVATIQPALAQEAAEAPFQQAPAGQPAPGAPLAQQQSPPVIATVNGDPITQPELTASVQTQLQQRQVDPQQLDPQSVQQLEQEALNNLIDSRLVEQYVIEEGPDVAEQEVQETLGQIKQEVEQQGVPFGQFLQQRGLSEETIKQRVEGSLAWNKYQQEQLTEEKLRQYFEANQEQFPFDSFDEAPQHVTQAYAAEIWKGIVERVRPQAEIELVQRGGVPGQPAPGAPQAPGLPE